jgi:hypothetical protein
LEPVLKIRWSVYQQTVEDERASDKRKVEYSDPYTVFSTVGSFLRSYQTLPHGLPKARSYSQTARRLHMSGRFSVRTDSFHRQNVRRFERDCRVSGSFMRLKVFFPFRLSKFDCNSLLPPELEGACC